MQNYVQETDEVLVRLYEEGNDAAFDQLLTRHQQKVFGYIMAIVHDEDKANDIFQDVFIKAITRIRSHRYVENGRFVQWLIRIAHNAIIDLYRHGSNIVTVSSDGDISNLRNASHACDSTVEDFLSTEQTYTDLEMMVERLPLPQQEVVKMRIYENRSFKEIAELTSCSINTALGRMHYAINNLRRMAKGRDLTILV